MSNYIISADVANDNPTVIITSTPYGSDWSSFISFHFKLRRIEKIRRIFNG
jgi:hypothetical protein